jgi:hypothetical protein
VRGAESRVLAVHRMQRVDQALAQIPGLAHPRILRRATVVARRYF